MFVRTEDFLHRAIHDARVVELVNQYEKKGYTAELNVIFDDCEFDMLFRHPEEEDILVEVKVRWDDRESHKDMGEFKRVADERGLKFRLAYVVTPGRKDIRIKWFNDALQSYIGAESSPLWPWWEQEWEEDEESVAVERVRRLERVGIDSIAVDNGTAKANGHGIIIVEHPDEDESEIPFDGEFELDMHSMQIQSANIIFDSTYL